MTDVTARRTSLPRHLKPELYEVSGHHWTVEWAEVVGATAALAAAAARFQNALDTYGAQHSAPLET